MVSCLLIVVAVISYTRGLSVTDSSILGYEVLQFDLLGDFFCSTCHTNLCGAWIAYII